MLFPESTIESPNAITAGTVTFGGSFIRAFALKHKVKNRMKWIKNEEVIGETQQTLVPSCEWNKEGFKCIIG